MRGVNFLNSINFMIYYEIKKKLIKAINIKCKKLVDVFLAKKDLLDKINTDSFVKTTFCCI